MKIEDIVACIESTEIDSTENQTRKMETEEVSVLGPMNMLAFDA